MKIRKTTICLLLTLFLTAGIASGFNLLRMTANDVIPWVDNFTDDSHDGAKTLATHIPTGNPERGPSSIVSSTGTIAPNYWSSDPVAGVDTVSNGDFPVNTDGWTADDATLTVDTARLKITGDGGAAGYGFAYQEQTTVIGTFYKSTHRVESGTADGYFRIAIDAWDGVNKYLNENVPYGTNTFYFKALSTSTFVAPAVRAGAAGFYCFYDNIKLEPLTFSELITLQDTGKSDICVKADLTIANNSLAGVVARYVDANNFLIAWVNETSGEAELWKCIAGTWTELIGTAVTYSAGATIQLVCDGNSIDLFYNNLKVGVTQTEATLSAATIHGGFSTDASNVVENLVVLDLVNLGSELVVDGGMEIDPTNNWTAYNATLAEETTIIQSGSKSLKLTDAGPAAAAYQQLTISTGTLVRVRAWGYAPSANASGTLNLGFTTAIVSGPIQWNINSVTQDSWVVMTGYFITISANPLFGMWADNGANDDIVYYDTVSIKPVSTTPISNDASWASGSGTFVTASARHTEVLGAEKITNTELTTDTTQWSGSADSIARVDSSADPGVDSTTSGAVDKWVIKATNDSGDVSLQPFVDLSVYTAGTFYKTSLIGYNPNAGFEAGMRINLIDENIRPSTSATKNVWVDYGPYYFKATRTRVIVGFEGIAGVGVNEVLYADKISVEPLTLSSTLTLAQLGFQSGRYWFTPSAATGELSGIVLFANDSVASTDGLWCYVDRTAGKMQVFKRVAGTDTSLISTAITYSAGAKGLLVYDKEQGGITCFYNNAIVGTFQAYTPAAGMTWGGGFSTGDATLDDFSFKPLSLGVELVTNGTMEADSNWDDWALEVGDVNERSTDQVYEGAYSRHINVDSHPEGMYQGTISITAGGLYKLDGYFYVVSGKGYINPADTDFGTGTVETTTTGSWERTTMYAIALTTKANAFIYIGSIDGVARFYSDNVSIRQVN